MAEDFYSFEKVLKELKLQEEELKRLVSEGEIRAFRDADKMKFKKEDIERFKAQRGADLPTLDQPAEELTEELFEEEGSEDVGMVTQQIDDSGLLEEVDEIEPLEEESAAPAPAAGRKSAGRPTRPAAGAAGRRSKTRRRAAVEETAGEGTGMQALLVISAIVLLYGVIVAFNAAEMQSTGMTRGFAQFVQDNFLK